MDKLTIRRILAVDGAISRCAVNSWAHRYWSGVRKKLIDNRPLMWDNSMDLKKWEINCEEIKH